MVARLITGQQGKAMPQRRHNRGLKKMGEKCETWRFFIEMGGYPPKNAWPKITENPFYKWMMYEGSPILVKPHVTRCDKNRTQLGCGTPWSPNGSRGQSLSPHRNCTGRITRVHRMAIRTSTISTGMFFSRILKISRLVAPTGQLTDNSSHFLDCSVLQCLQCVLRRNLSHLVHVAHVARLANRPVP